MILYTRFDMRMQMIVRDATEIGQLIRDTRNDLGLSQRALAERVSIHQPKVSEIERGKDTAQIGIVLRILAALDLNIHIGTEQNAEDSRTAITDEPDYDDGIDLDAIADTGLKR